VFKPVKKLSVSDAVFEQLRDQIVSGEVAAGSQLPGERVLSETLGVNRGAIREALKRLSQAGLVSIQHGGGTHVLNFRNTAGLDLLTDLMFTGEGELDPQIVRSGIEMRFAAVPHVARLAARRGSPELELQLNEKLSQLRAVTGDPAQALVLRWEFWEILVEASENLAYRLAFNTLGRGFQRALPYLEHALKPIATDSDLHGLVVSAVVSGDEDAAERAAKEAVAPMLEKLLNSLDQDAMNRRENAVG
jgi:GntR family transcriptional repressor for pyruvate dehydrogenase complex